MFISLLKALASFLTIVAGHLLNRRLDRAILFFSLYVVGIFGIFYGAFYFIHPALDVHYMQWYRRVLFIMSGSGLLILIISAVVTFIDSGHEFTSRQTAWSLGGRIGAVLMSGLGLIGTVYLVVILSSAVKLPTHVKMPKLGKEQGSHRYYLEDQFSSYVDFGGRSADLNASPAPAGKGYLLGRIEYAGKPAAGVTLELSLNERYRVHDITTDKQGRFMLRLVPGKWKVDSISGNAWQHKPDGEFVLVSGHEPMLTNGTYSRYMPSSDGLSLDVTVHEPAQPQINLVIHRKFSLLNPPKRDTATTLSLAKDAIHWSAYPGAAKYQVVISKVTRLQNEGSITSLTMKIVNDNTQLALKQFKTVPGHGSPQEYFVKVYAFDQTGHYLSESDEGFNWDHTFKLAENREISDHRDMPDELSDTLAIEKNKHTQAWVKAEEKLNAVEVLIRAKMYVPAKTLLDGIDAQTASPGRVSAVTGYWYASQGICKQAETYFDKARKQGGSLCVLAEYMKGCQK